MVGVHPMPNDVDPLRVGHHFSEHAPDERGVIRLFVGLIAVNHELEAPDTVRNGYRHVGTAGIRAHFAVRMAEWIIRAVDDQPARRGCGAVERHSHQSSGCAAAAVAADDISGADGFASVGELDRDTSRGFGAVLHRMAPPHFDVVESLKSDKQFGIDHRLDEAVALRPPEARIGGCHLGEQFPLRVEEPQDLVGHRVRQNLVHQSDALEGAQRLVVQADAAGIVDEVVSLVDHQRPDTLQAKDVRQGESHGARPDDDDIEFLSHGQRPSRKSRWSRLKVLGSSY